MTATRRRTEIGRQVNLMRTPYAFVTQRRDLKTHGGHVCHFITTRARNLPVSSMPIN